MNILRKTRKSNIKLDKKRIVLLIFTFIMATFAWISYSKILLPNIKMQINSWNISIYVDENKNGVAETSELVENKENLISIEPFEIYPGMSQEVMNVIIKNNGETPCNINYIINDIMFLGKTYSIQEDAADYRNNNPGSYCLQKNTYETSAGIVTYKLINEENYIPFDFIIEHTDFIDGGTEGYLKVKAIWNAIIENENNEEEIEARDTLDTLWGAGITDYAEANPSTAPIKFNLNVNAIGQQRSSKYALTKDISPENYGDYVDYSIDLNNDGNTTNDWRIFFEDNENIYIISANYLLNSKIPTRIMGKYTERNYVKYGVYFPSDKLIVTSISQPIINKYMLTSAIASTNNNYKATASLLSTSDWASLVNTNFAETAVGSPTIEMFAKSWNQKYNGKEGYSELITTWNNKKDRYEINNAEQFQVGGYNNASLYFPSNTLDSCDGYWLASPGGNDNETLLSVKNNGIIKGEKAINYKACGIRPVIRLKSGLKGEVSTNANGDKVWTLVQP